MLLGGHGMRLAKRDGSLHATLPATDSGNHHDVVIPLLHSFGPYTSGCLTSTFSSWGGFPGTRLWRVWSAAFDRRARREQKS